MLKSYLRIAFRNLVRFKAYSLINVFGLALGIASCIVILLFVDDELSYDKFNEKAERIYRVHTRGKLLGNDLNMAVSPAPLGETMVLDYPEVIQSARLGYNANMLIRYKDNVFNETRFFWADSTIFEIFTMQFIQGDPKTALDEPHTIVLTETLAKKYFGKEDPIDKIMNMEDGTAYTVRGVIKDCPSNSHFHYDLFASLSSWGGSERNTYWVSNNFYTYILLKEGTSGADLQKKLPEFAKKYAGPQIQQLLGITYDEALGKGYVYEFLMQPLLDIHLHSHLDYEIEPNSDIRYVYIFSIIAGFILVIACINFMNLTTARSSTRSKEVGIRKVLGSSKAKLIKQFLTESVLLAFFAVLIAIVLVEILLPSFSQLSGKDLQTNYFENLLAIPALIGTILFVGFLAGIYPAFFLSSFQPVKTLKGKPNEGKKSFLRSGLVVFQFAITIILFASTLIVYNQMKFIQDKKLGFDKEHVLVIQRAWALEDHAKAFKEELLRNSNIVSASNTDNLPGRLFGQTVFKPEDAPLSQQYPLAIMATDYDFSKTLGLKMVEGRYFSRESSTDTTAIILNENAVKFMDMKDPIGKRLVLPDPNQSRVFTIVGVLKDFHYESLHQHIRPLAIFLNSGQTAYLPIRIRPNDVSKTISFVKDQWNEFVPGKPFEYFFLDEDFNRLYQSEQKTGQIFSAFSILAIFIACLGLFGLTAFTVERRIKEIGIRKVLGASVSTIVLLISKEFLKWVLIANLIAWPVAYFYMNSWMENFAYKTNISIWVFIFSGIIALLIALLTVISQTIKAATANPVKSLRYE
ncbi:MAG TPA: ABC transporter permease [Ignavibacteriaceae bacterium]|nr:ABC transporter permease [Ignavibacteriaceae bacterium]